MKIAITYPPLESDKGIPLLGQNRQFQWFNNPTYIYPMVPAYAATLWQSKGFDVTWTSTNITKRCTPFTVDGPTGQADNICNYGIVYKVTWEYVK